MTLFDTRRRVGAKLRIIDTTFNLESKTTPPPSRTPGSARSVNSVQRMFFDEKGNASVETSPVVSGSSRYESSNPFHDPSDLSIRIPKSPAKPNPYAGQSPSTRGNPFVNRSPHSTTSSAPSSRSSPRSGFAFPRNNPSPKSSAGIALPKKNGYIDLNPKSEIRRSPVVEKIDNWGKDREVEEKS